jgi:hypothetical protein
VHCSDDIYPASSGHMTSELLRSPPVDVSLLKLLATVLETTLFYFHYREHPIPSE